MSRNSQGTRLHRIFHGRAADAQKVASFTVPKELIYLGRAVSVVYETDKLHGGGDGQLAHYQHKFETPVGLFMDEHGEKQLYLLGTALIVTENGIEN